jgi:pentatricopeptide repeat protein
MKGRSHLRPVWRSLNRLTSNVGLTCSSSFSSSHEECLSAGGLRPAASDAIDVNAAVVLLKWAQIGRLQQESRGGDARVFRSVSLLHTDKGCVQCLLRGSAATAGMCTSVIDSDNISNASTLHGDTEAEFASTPQDSPTVPFRRKGGDRFVRSRTNTVVAGLVKLLEAAPTTADARAILDSRAEDLLHPQSWPWLSLLDALQKGPKPQVAIEVFNWKKSKLGWEANPKEYAKMISFAGRISQPQLALELFNEMETRGIKKTAVSYNALIHACGRNDEADKALRLFEEMKNTDTCQPTLVTYNTLISMYSRLGLTDNMKKIFEMCKEAGFSPDRHTYNALIWGFMRAGQLDQMESTVEELHASECKADVITYNAQIIGYARANAVDKMEVAFTSMQRSGIPINAMVGEILAEVYSRMRMFEKMENTLKIMDDTPGVQYGSRVHSMVIESYADTCRLDEMEAAIQRMFKNKRMFASPRTLEAVIMGYSRSRAYDRLVKAMEVVKGSGWNFHVSMYNVLINEYGKGRQFDKMEQVLSDMHQANVKPSSEAYQIMLDTYDREGKEVEVSRVVDLMRSAGFEPRFTAEPLDRMWTDDEIFGGRARR